MRHLLQRYRRHFVHAGLFSAALNALVLIPSLYMLQVFDRVLVSRVEETLVMLTLITVAGLAAMGGFEVLRTRLLGSAARAMERHASPEVLLAQMRAAQAPGGGVAAAALKDVATIRGFLTGPGILALFDAPWLVVFIIVIYAFHPLLGVIATAGGLLLLGLAILNETMTRQALKDVQAQSRQIGRTIEVSLRNAEVIAALGIADTVVQRWERSEQDVARSRLRAEVLAARFAATGKVLRQALQVAMLGAGAWLVIRLHATPGLMIAGTILLGRALAPVELLISGWRNLVEARDALQRLEPILAERPPAPTPTPLPAPSGQLRVEKVTFRPGTREEPILKQVSFDMEPGDAVAIVGPSGCGKTTLARVVLGLWAPQSGVVRLDGADIAQWPRERLGPHLGYVPQDVELFNGTISENIARMRTPDPEAVLHAARRADAHELILRLPKGYDTPIGDGGALLSAGQRQRIALARALYGNPRLVVLDEPNANLDSEGEDALLGVLKSLAEEGVSVLVISHRPNLLGVVRKILVMRDGSVEAFLPREEFFAKLARAAKEQGRTVGGLAVLPSGGAA